MKKGIISSIIITIIVGIFISLYGLGIIMSLWNSQFKFPVILIGVIFIILLIMLIYTLIQRIKEIKEEDKDDISKY